MAQLSGSPIGTGPNAASEVSKNNGLASMAGASGGVGKSCGDGLISGASGDASATIGVNGCSVLVAAEPGEDALVPDRDSKGYAASARFKHGPVGDREDISLVPTDVNDLCCDTCEVNMADECPWRPGKTYAEMGWGQYDLTWYIPDGETAAVDAKRCKGKGCKPCDLNIKQNYPDMNKPQVKKALLPKNDPEGLFKESFMKNRNDIENNLITDAVPNDLAAHLCDQGEGKGGTGCGVSFKRWLR